MKTKTGKLIVMLSMTGLINLSMGTAIADDKGIKHNVADLNYDGMVTSEELVTYVQINFLKMDKNNDQMLDTAEWDDIFDIDG